MAGINIVLLQKAAGERYLFTWDDEPASRVALLDSFGRFASDPELSFSWYDAARLSKSARTVGQVGPEAPVDVPDGPDRLGLSNGD